MDPLKIIDYYNPIKQESKKRVEPIEPVAQTQDRSHYAREKHPLYDVSAKLRKQKDLSGGLSLIV